MKANFRFLSGVTMLALLLGVPTGHALAVQVSQDGTGQVLLFPVVAQGTRYDTLLSLTNQDTERPALLRVTIRQGVEGAARARMNVYLGAGDSFTAAISGMGMTPSEGTCFASDPAPSDAGSITLGLGGTAFLEVIEMATVSPATATAELVDDPGEDCTAVQQAVDDRAALDGLEAPAGHITGSLTLIDVPLGLSFSMAPTVLDHFRETPIYRPVDDPQPGLYSVEPAESVLLGRFTPGGERSATLTSTWEHPVDAVSAVLMANTSSTDFNVEPGIAANTDVLLTFPTRHHYQGATQDDERNPFVTRYVRSNVNVDPIETPGQQFLLIARDRQGDTVIDTFGAKCSPALVNPYPGPLLTGSQLNLRVGAGEVIPGMTVHEAQQVSEQDQCHSVHATPVHELMESGTLEMDFGAFSMTSMEGHVHHGLPVIGTSLTAIANETTTLANYGATTALRRTRHVTYPVAADGLKSQALASDEERAAPRPDISGDGNVIAWNTDVPLAPEDTESGDQDVYLFGDGNPQPRLVTPTLSEFPEDVRTYDLARNGDALAYIVCKAVPDGPNSGRCEPSLRLHALSAGDIIEISPPEGEVETFFRPRISSDGNLVAYQVIASQAQLYLYDRISESGVMLTDDVKRLFDMTHDGSLVLFSTGQFGAVSESDELHLVETATGTIQPALPPDLRERLDARSENQLIQGASISANGRHLAFSVSGGIQGFYWYDRQADELQTISRVDPIFHSAGEVAVSADGQTVAFSMEQARASGLAPNVRQVYLWRTDGSREIVSLSSDGFAANGESLRPALSDDARILVYSSAADNIGPPATIPDETPQPAYHLIRVELPPAETSR